MSAAMCLLRLQCSQSPGAQQHRWQSRQMGSYCIRKKEITMEGSHASMQKASKLPREPCADGRRGKGPIMWRNAQRRQHMMTGHEGRHLAVRHAALSWRQGGPCQQTALVALSTRHDCWETCRVAKHGSARLYLSVQTLPRQRLVIPARALMHWMRDGPCAQTHLYILVFLPVTETPCFHVHS